MGLDKRRHQKMDIHSKRKHVARIGRPRTLDDDSRQRKMPRTFSIRQVVLDQLEFAVSNHGINPSAVVERQIVSYLRRVDCWPPPSDKYNVKKKEVQNDGQ